MRFFVVLGMVLLLGACSENKWSEEDQQVYLKDCLQMAAGTENAEEVCDCGLQKSMEKFASKKEAEREVRLMTEEELEAFYADCL